MSITLKEQAKRNRQKVRNLLRSLDRSWSDLVLDEVMRFVGYKAITVHNSHVCCTKYRRRYKRFLCGCTRKPSKEILQWLGRQTRRSQVRL